MALKSVREIRCALTDEEYHAVYDEVATSQALLSLLRGHVGDGGDSETLIALRLLIERQNKAAHLLEEFWKQTREARHG